MKLFSIGVGAVCALALSAGMAAAQMQPIPNPPESGHKMMHGKHHGGRHHGRHHVHHHVHHHHHHMAK